MVSLYTYIAYLFKIGVPSTDIIFCESFIKCFTVRINNNNGSHSVHRFVSMEKSHHSAMKTKTTALVLNKTE